MLLGGGDEEALALTTTTPAGLALLKSLDSGDNIGPLLFSPEICLDTKFGLLGATADSYMS